MKKHALSMYSLLSITLLFTTMLHTSEKKEETEKFEIIAVTVTDLQKPAAKPVGWFGSLYSQSWILSKPQLLLYAFEYNLFEKKNKEHKQLVNDALLVCVQQKDVTTLSKIATTLHEKFPTTTTLCTNKTARRIHDFITARQQADCISTNKELKTQRTQAASEINEHIKNIQSTIGLLIRMADMYESRQQGDFQNLCSNNKKHKSITLLLHQISGIDDAEDIITNCSDNDEEGQLKELDDFTDTYHKSKIDGKTFDHFLEYTKNLKQQLAMMSDHLESIDLNDYLTYPLPEPENK